MNLQVLKILKDNLVYTGFRNKFNILLDKIIYEIILVDNNTKLRFVTADGNIDVILPVPSLDNISNVEITSAQIGNVLTYDGTVWRNGVPSDGSIINASDTEITNIQNNDTLLWDDILGKFVNSQVSASARLNELLDVILDVNLEEDDILVYNGVNWINRKITDISYVEDTEYLSNNFIQDGKSYNETLSDLDEILSLISPIPADSLTGKNLALTNTVLFSAKISAGLTSSWYQHPTLNQPGDTIDSYIVDNIYRLTSPMQATTFRVGKKDEPQGQVEHILDGVVFNTKIVTIPNTNNIINTILIGNSNLNVSSTTYNNIWQRGNSFIDFSQFKEGHITHTLRHSVGGNISGGETNIIRMWYDNNGTAIPNFAQSPIFSLVNQQIKFLSGIQYLGLNTTIDISYTAASGIFSKCYHPTNVSIISSTFINSVTVNPITVPNFNDSFIVTNRNITLDRVDLSSGASNGTINVTLFRPNGATRQEVITLNNRVCTFGIDSTLVRDRFFDEDKRLVINTTNSFNSSIPLPNTEAQVRNGSLVYGNIDYPSKTGLQEYQRRFRKVSASNGVINFAGINVSSISSFNTGSLNVLLWLEGSNKYFDLGRDFGSNNGNGNGSTRLNSFGGRNTGGTSGSNLAFSFGLYNTADLGNNNQYRIIVIFRDNTTAKNLVITSIVTS